MSEPTRFVRADLPGATPKNTATVSVPAADMIKGGLGMFLIGVYGFITRRDVSWTMQWMPRK